VAVGFGADKNDILGMILSYSHSIYHKYAPGPSRYGEEESWRTGDDSKFRIINKFGACSIRHVTAKLFAHR
jgi:hypothetical protein